MTESFVDKLRRRALRLVLEKKFTPNQAAKTLQCTPRAVRRWVQDHLENKDLAQVESLFVSVEMFESDDAVPESPSDPTPGTTVSLDILTANGLTLRLQLASLADVATLLRTLEADRC